MKDAVFVTARLKSTRLPRKVLRPVNGKVVLGYLIDRLKINLEDTGIILCTSDHDDDDALEHFCDEFGIACFRGSEEDVLDRYFQCAVKFAVDNLYILYGDEPFVDIRVLKNSFNYLKIDSKSFVDNSNLVDGTFGYGLSFNALKYICSVKQFHHNEVWGSYVSALPITKIITHYDEISPAKATVRLTIDYPEDLIVFEKMVEILDKEVYTANLDTLLRVYNENKFWEINGPRAADYVERISAQSLKPFNP